jgi:hypothetical protein
MPPTDRFVISFAAEPPQDSLPNGDWAETLAEHFLSACEDIDTDGEELGDPGEIRWFPDRTYAGRTYVPATARTAEGFEMFGFVSFIDGGGQAIGPSDFVSRADYTGELAEDNPEWKLDLNDEVIGNWRGEKRKHADITLVWGVPLIVGGTLVTAELANLAVDQCDLVDDRFTLIAPDNYRGDYIDVKLWGRRGNQLAAESLYVDDDEGDAEDDDG